MNSVLLLSVEQEGDLTMFHNDIGHILHKDAASQLKTRFGLLIHNLGSQSVLGLVSTYLFATEQNVLEQVELILVRQALC